jgi:site-specific recombinase XerD
MEAGGMTIREVNRIINHSTIQMTEYYAHDVVKKPLNIGLE